MFVYLFVWETLGIPQRHQRETTGRPAGTPETPQQDKREQKGLVHVGVLQNTVYLTHRTNVHYIVRDTSRSTREKLDVIIHKLSGILLTLFVWCVMYLRIIFK